MPRSSPSTTTATVPGHRLDRHRDHLLGQLGLLAARCRGRTGNVAQTAYRMGIQTSLATPDVDYSIGGHPFAPYNPALILGGLRTGRQPARDGPCLPDPGSRRPDRVAARWPTPRRDRSGSRRSRTTDGDLIETNDGDPGQDRVETKQVVAPERRGHRADDPAHGGHPGDRPNADDRRPGRVGQDRHHREQRRRLVRRLQPGRHSRRLGRPRRLREADADRVRRLAGRRRDDPGADLQRGRPCLRRPEGLQEAAQRSSESTTSTTPTTIAPVPTTAAPRPSATPAPQSAGPGAAAAQQAPQQAPAPSNPAPSGGGSPSGGSPGAAASRDRRRRSAQRSRQVACCRRRRSATAAPTPRLIPIRGPASMLTSRLSGRGPRSSNGPSVSRRPVQLQPDAERLGQLARARSTAPAAGLARGARPSARSPSAAPGHGSAPRPRRPRGSADEVQAGVDPVGAVDVRSPGWTEQRRGSLGQSDVGVTGGVVALVALGFDDHAPDAVDRQRAADQVPRDCRAPSGRRTPPRAERRASVAAPSSRSGSLHSASAAAAFSSCSASRAEAVPPSDDFDSSHRSRREAPRSRRRRAARSGGVGPPASARRAPPRSRASRTSPPTTPCASLNGIPFDTRQVGDVGRG